MQTKVAEQSPPAKVDARTAWTIFATLLFSTFVTIEAAAFQAPAMPMITRHFGINVTSAALITTLYYVAAIAFAPIMGRLADRTGRKRMVMFGLLVFSVSEAVAAFSPSFGIFLAARFLQGYGVACILPVILAYIGVLFSAKQRGMALGVLSFSMLFGATTGGAVAGVMIDRFGWPSIYWVSGALGMLGLGLVAWLVPATAPGTAKRAKFDWKGALLLFVAVGALLSTPTWAGNYGMDSPQAIGALATAALAMLALWFIEQRVAAPAVDVSLLRIRTFILPALIFILYGICYAGILYSLAFFIVERPGGSSAQFGIVTMVLFGTGMLAAPLSGRLVDLIDPRSVVLTALAGGFGVLLLLSTFTNATPLWFVLMTVMLLGLANGMKTPASMKIALNSIPQDKLGAGSGLLSMLRDIGTPAGAAFGLAIFGATVGERTSSAALAMASTAGVSPALLNQVAAAAASRGKSVAPQLAAELQRLGISITDLLGPAKVAAISSAMPQVAYVLMGILGVCFLFALMLPRLPKSAKQDGCEAAPAKATIS